MSPVFLAILDSVKRLFLAAWRRHIVLDPTAEIGMRVLARMLENMLDQIEAPRRYFRRASCI